MGDLCERCGERTERIRAGTMNNPPWCTSSPIVDAPPLHDNSNLTWSGALHEPWSNAARIVCIFQDLWNYELGFCLSFSVIVRVESTMLDHFVIILARKDLI